MKKLIGVRSNVKPESLTVTPTIADVVSNIQVIEETDPMDNTKTNTVYVYDVDRYPIIEWEDLLSTQQTNKILLSKSMLESYLAEHPIEFNGKYYTITQDKQTQLIGTLNMYKEVEATNKEREAAGLDPIPFDLTWNATGEPCVSWTYEDLSLLLMNIYAYVKILVTEQQYIEVAIKSCTTKQELEAVVIDYETCPYSPHA